MRDLTRLHRDHLWTTVLEILGMKFRCEYIGMMCLSQGPRLLRCLADPVGRYIVVTFIFGFLLCQV